MSRARLALLNQRLTEVDTAIHRLMTGTMVVQVRNAAGRFVQYAQPQLAALRTYRAEVQAEIASVTGGPTLARRPILARF